MSSTDIREVTIGDSMKGDETHFVLNHWTGNVLTKDEERVVAPVNAKTRNGGVEGWKTRQGALHYAEGLRSIRWPGEEIFLVANRVLPEGDEPPCFEYFVVGPITAGTFDLEA